MRHRLRSALERATVAFAPALALIAAELPWDHSEGVLEPEGEAIVEIVNDCLRGWRQDGALAFLALVERDSIGDASTYQDELVRAAAAHHEVVVALHASAERGVRVAAEAVAQLAAQAFDRDLDGLARRLTEEVFPPGWPAASGT